MLTDVQRLLRQGRKTDAAALMQSWLDGRPAVDGPYCDAVALWYGADLYEEALATFERYRERTGKDLRCEYSEEEIRAPRRSTWVTTATEDIESRTDAAGCGTLDRLAPRSQGVPGGAQ